MSRKLVVFGTGDYAQLAQYYFDRDSNYKVVALSLDETYIEEPNLCGLPVVPYEKLLETHPPDDHDLFIALGYSKINSIRKEKYLAAKALGYQLASFISSHATVLNDGKVGDNTFIFENNTIQPFVSIGNNVTLWSGNHVGHHSVINDHSFITSHVVISGRVQVGEQCFVGVNATLRDHINIGARSVIGAGALILKDTEPDSLFIGAATEVSKVPSSRLRRI